MKKFMFTLALALVTVSVTFAQAGTQLDNLVASFQRVYNAQQFDSVYDLLSFRLKGMLTADKSKQSMAGLYGQMGKLESFEFLKSEDAMSYYKVSFSKQKVQMLTSLSPDNKFDAMRFLPLKKEAAFDPKAPSFDYNLKAGAVMIHGTLTMPVTTAKVPVVLLIAGSGPTDRDGNNNMGLATNTYLMLADSLQKAGIACVRYDKRGVGESSTAIKNEADMRFDSGINDAIGYLNMLKADTRFSEIIIVGHSEGSLIGMIAATHGGVKKYVSISGAGEAADKILKTQTAAESKELSDKAVVIMDSIKKGYEVKDIPVNLANLFHASVQPYMRSWFKYDPTVEIKKLKMPVLILQGKNDLQVAVMDAENLKKAAPKAKLVLIDKMNHILKDAPEDKKDNYATYRKAELPLNSELSSSIITFIKS